MVVLRANSAAAIRKDVRSRRELGRRLERMKLLGIQIRIGGIKILWNVILLDLTCLTGLYTFFGPLIPTTAAPHYFRKTWDLTISMKGASFRPSLCSVVPSGNVEFGPRDLIGTTFARIMAMIRLCALQRCH